MSAFPCVEEHAFPVATEQQLLRAEEAIGLGRLPDEYRGWLADNDGLEGWFGNVYLTLFPTDSVVDVSRTFDHARFPGLVAIGSDGGGETIALDLRSVNAPVVLVNNVSAGWHEGLLQAVSFSEFMAQRAAGEEFNWTAEYGSTT
jgi:hypothetical protein